MEEITVALKQKNLKVTSDRKDILSILRGAFEPLSIAKIHALLSRDSSLNLTTVYRNIEILARVGLVKKLNFGDNLYLYEFVDQSSHHHHLICTSCGKIVDLEEDAREGFLAKIAQKNKFEITDHNFEIFGLCADCKRR